MCSKHTEGSSKPRPETEVKAIDRTYQVTQQKYHTPEKGG
jgi:hypothetical protein